MMPHRGRDLPPQLRPCSPTPLLPRREGARRHSAFWTDAESFTAKLWVHGADVMTARDPAPPVLISIDLQIYDGQLPAKSLVAIRRDYPSAHCLAPRSGRFSRANTIPQPSETVRFLNDTPSSRVISPTARARFGRCA